MESSGAPDPTARIVTRRQLLRGVGVGAGLIVLGARSSLAGKGGHDETVAGKGGHDEAVAGKGGQGTEGTHEVQGTHDAPSTQANQSGLANQQPLTETIRGTSRIDATLVPAGSTLRFDPTEDTTLEVTGNLVVEGMLVMRPNPGVQHVLRFVDVDESAFVGGGLDVLDTDVGLWVMGDGVLNIRGTKKQAWNRQGDDRTWRRRDELVVAPMRADDFTPNGFRKGNHVPRLGNRLAEVLNLTRNVRIEGTPGGRAHVFIRSTQPQSIRYATLRYLGPRQPGGETTESVLGRYGLHFHHCHDGSRGSVVEGVVVRDCGGHAFVPHMSHGIKIRSCIAYEVFDDAYWWDENEETNDLLIDRCVAASVHHDPEIHGHRLAGFLLGAGRRLEIRRCVAFAVHGGKTAAGYVWPEAHSGLWTFEDNVAHNNTAAGIFVWQNNREPHMIERFAAFRNGLAGIIHGAYANSYHYRDLDLRHQRNAVELHAAAKVDNRGPQSWADVRGGTLTVLSHSLPGEAPVLFRRCSFRSGITIDDAEGEPGPLDFVNCGLRPRDFDVISIHPSTVVRVQRANGSAFKLTASGLQDIGGFFPY